MSLFHVQVNDGTGWQTASTHATADEARAVCEWYNDRRLKARVTFDEPDDDRLSVAVDRMIDEAEGKR